MITFDSDSKAKVCSTKFGNLPFGVKLSLEFGESSGSTADGEKVYCDEEDTDGSTMEVNKVFAF